jgi:hypothetical protein
VYWLIKVSRLKKFLLIFALLALGLAYVISQKDHIRIAYNDYGVQDIAFKKWHFFVTSEFDDGPYLVKQDQTLTDYSIKRGELQVSNVPSTADFPMKYAANKIDTFNNVTRIAAISDLHGQFSIFERLLIANGIMDEQSNWTFGNGHLVITGDIFAKGDTVTEILWLVYKLEKQAQQAGGKLHYLLGNHEYKVLRGEYNYTHLKYIESMQVIGQDLQSLLGENTVLGQWLRSKSTIIKINDLVFVHGGIHQNYLDLQLPLEESNQIFRMSIGLSKSELKSDPVLNVLHSKTGPVWYRGFLTDEKLNQAQVEHLLKQLNAKHIVFGHTSLDQVETRHNNLVIAIDTAIKKGEKGEILLWQDQRFFSADMMGTQSLLF